MATKQFKIGLSNADKTAMATSVREQLEAMLFEEYNADTVIMYDQISCKGMDGLHGIFYDQAREKGVNFIWVRQDLMDPRTISRREMREQVNKYMQTVMQEEPLDPSLLDFEDDLAW